MASNILSGDRRWASARKSGMTILGKVPKPINLPSQRLENNGLDPNVEIVPKGTLTWGTRTSSATPNVWSSSTLISPKTDGSTSSPSHYSGRPSSGGSGTRPSTAGSDRSQEPSPNAWGSNSRPSTASGLLPSNQTPKVAARPRSAETRPMVAARPRSAETRPGSSQLSRFAENSAEHAVAWGARRTSEKLGVLLSKTDEFSLSSGDFPTLGSEKKSESNSQQGHSSQGHSSAAGGTLRPDENLELPISGDGFVDHENVGTLRTERNSYAERGAALNIKWQNNPQQAQPYQNSKMIPHQFDSLHGPPIHPPDGIWYRGGAIGGPYRPAGPLPPGSFPVDPFAYYPRPFQPNSEVVPRPGAGPGNYHPINGETYRPQVLPNSYMFPGHPVIPARPGTYQTPVPYDGNYSYHQGSFVSSGEQQIPPTGVATRPGVYNQYPNHSGNFNSGEFQNSPSGDDSQMAKGQIISDRACVPHQGHYKVLLKPHGDLEDSHPQEKGKYASSTLHSDVETKSRGSSSKQEGEKSIGSGKNEGAKFVKLATDHQAPSKLVSDCEDHPSNLVSTNSKEISCRTSEGILKTEPGTVILEVHDRKHYPITRKNAALIEKIECLNNKTRSADTVNDVGQLPLRPERSKQPRAVNAKTEHSARDSFSNAASTENASTSSTRAMPVSFEESSSDGPTSSTTVMPLSSEGSPSKVINKSKPTPESTVISGTSESQDFDLMRPDSLKPGEAVYSHVPKRVHATRSRADYHAKSRSDNECDIRGTRESSGKYSSAVPLEKTVADDPVIGILDNHSSKEAILTSSSDSLDHKAQRAKLKELAAQRAKQLQKEEEERTREQKAKALAKLEDLNRRSAAQSMKQKLNDDLFPRNDVQHQEDSSVDSASQINAAISNKLGDILLGNAHASDSENKKHGTAVALSLNSASCTSKTISQETAVLIAPSLPLGHETNTAEVAIQNISSQSHGSSGSKHKQMGYRRRQKVPLEKNSGERPAAVEDLGQKYLDDAVYERRPDEKPITAEIKESHENLVEVNTPAPNTNSESSLHNEDPSLHHKKKSSRNSRNKLMGSGLSLSAHSHENVDECPSESSKSHPRTSFTEIPPVPAQLSVENSESQGLRDDIVHSKEACCAIIEESHGGMSNQWKPQPPRRPARNQQVSRLMDKVHASDTVVWAPIKAINKNEQSQEISQSSITGSNSQSSQRNEHDTHNGTRAKRAEMERYVPKPVAKELLQQENSRKPSSFVNQSASNDMPEKSYSDSKGTGMDKFDGSVVRTDFIADTKNGNDNKPSKRGRTHASWRQRSSPESTLPLQSSNERSNSSDAPKPFDKPSDQHLLLPEQSKSDNWGSSSNAVPKDSVLPTVIKDQRVSNRQKHQQFHRVAGSSYVTPAHHHLQSGIDDRSDVGSPILDINEADARNSIKGDNRNASGEHIRTQSHWKPKSQACSHHQQQESRGNGGQRNSSRDGWSAELTSSGFENNPSNNENSTALTQKDGSHAVTDVGHRDTMGTDKAVRNSELSMEQMHIPPPDVPTNTALPPGNVNIQHENQVSLPLRRHGHRSGRFNRGQESTYGSRDLMQISGKPNEQINGDKQKNNSHFGYQPVGSYNKPGDLSQLNSNIDREAQGHQASRTRYKERIHTQTRNPGHFIRRNSGATAHVSDSYHREE